MEEREWSGKYLWTRLTRARVINHSAPWQRTAATPATSQRETKVPLATSLNLPPSLSLYHSLSLMDSLSLCSGASCSACVFN